jgi:hypothetical protein
MAGVPVPAYQQFWADKGASLEKEFQTTGKTHPDAVPCMQHLFKVLGDLQSLAGCTPRSVGESEEWAAVIRAAEDNLESYSMGLQGKSLYSALYGSYTVTLNDLKHILKSSGQTRQPSKADGFQEVRSRKRHSTAEAAHSPKIAAVPSPVQVPTRNFFAPLWTAQMDTYAPDAETSTDEASAPSKAARPPPIVLTSAANLIQLQKKLKGVARQSFELRNTSGARVVTKDMVDYQAVKAHFTENNIAYSTFFPKSERPVTAVLRHLPSNTPAKDISDGLVDLDFDVVSVKQMSSARRSPDGSNPITLPLFLVTLPRTQKSQENFKLSSLCHICIKVEAHKSQSSLTQCFNCQQFGHVWANCKQPPHCLWCGGGHLHKDCPEKGKTSSTPACCNCQLAEGEKPYPANYHLLQTRQGRDEHEETPRNTQNHVW